MKECARPGYGLIYFGEKIPGVHNGRGTRGSVPCNKSGRPLPVAHTYDVNAHNTRIYNIYCTEKSLARKNTHSLRVRVRATQTGGGAAVRRADQIAQTTRVRKRAITSRQTRQMVFSVLKYGLGTLRNAASWVGRFSVRKEERNHETTTCHTIASNNVLKTPKFGGSVSTSSHE